MPFSPTKPEAGKGKMVTFSKPRVNKVFLRKDDSGQLEKPDHNCPMNMGRSELVYNTKENKWWCRKCYWEQPTGTEPVCPNSCGKEYEKLDRPTKILWCDKCGADLIMPQSADKLPDAAPHPIIASQKSARGKDPLGMSLGPGQQAIKDVDMRNNEVLFDNSDDDAGHTLADKEPHEVGQWDLRTGEKIRRTTEYIGKRHTIL